MIKDYSYIALTEGANRELVSAFVRAIQIMDPALAEERLLCLVQSHPDEQLFRSIAACFCHLVGTKTCVDK